jgi:L-tyrosine isonitrile synthase
MQEYDLLLAGDPAGIKHSHEHTLGDAQADCENYRWDGDTVGAVAGSERKRRLLHAASHKKASAEKVLQSFNTWAFKREQPSDRQLMLQVIQHAIRCSEPLSFALYWGKGPRCALDQPDIQCLDFLALLADRVRNAHAPGAALNLIFTDTHARLNGHTQTSIQKYFSAVDVAAHQRGFATFWLGELARLQIAAAKYPEEETVQQPTLSRLIASARKWYRGGGSPEQGALMYYRMNMVERRAVELAFPRSIFITFNGRELRGLFPEHLPIFYMYSLRRGISAKPWFLPAEADACMPASCKRRHSISSD